MDEPKRKRWQLSLRRLFVAVSMVASALAVLVAVNQMEGDTGFFVPPTARSLIRIAGAVIGAALGLVIGTRSAVLFWAAVGYLVAALPATHY